MTKRKQNIDNLGLVKGFFSFNPNKWIIGVSTVLFFCIILYFLNFRKINVFPSGNDFRFNFYDDSANGGNSEILQFNVSDTLINLDFNLNEGFISPYVGITVASQKDSLIDLSHYNLIHLNIKGMNINNIGLALYTRNPYKNVNNSELCFYTNLEISSDIKQYDIKLNQLKIPDWWRDLYNISPDQKVEPDLNRVLRLNVGTSHATIIETKSSLQIGDISFDRNNSELILFLITSEILVITLLFVIHYLRTRPRKSTEPVTITYQPLEIKDQSRQLNSFLDYINNNFQENELSLEQVAKYTGINERRIANTIQENFGCNFKSYINQIRINESKRLLKESDLNIGEIAFKIGFNNQSHFNRVFKNLTGTSPSAFREDIK